MKELKVGVLYFSTSEKNALRAKAEIAMMGRTQFFSNDDEVFFVVDYIIGTLHASHIFDTEVTATKVLESAYRYCDRKKQISSVVVNIILGEMICITLPMSSRLVSPAGNMLRDGVLTYVYNLTAPECSELGYSYFEKKSDQFIHRVG